MSHDLVVKKLTMYHYLLVLNEQRINNDGPWQIACPSPHPLRRVADIKGYIQSRCASVANEMDVPPRRSPPDNVKFVEKMDCTHSLTHTYRFNDKRTTF